MSQKPFPLGADGTLRVPSPNTLSDATLRVPSPASPAPPPTTPEADATLLVGREKPVSPLPEVEPHAPLVTTRRLPLGVLEAGAVLCGDCIVRETIRPQETTRPGLYDCDAPEGRVMVKIAAAEYPPVEDLWLKLPALSHPALLKTHRVAHERGFCAEIQEFCEGGTLDSCIPRDGKAPLAWEIIERGIVASFIGGIAYLHTNGIVHRDVKPKNLYLRKNGDKVALVIGDFDISSVIENDHTSRDTPRGAGTHYYMAPEAFPRFVDPSAGRAAAIVSPASDYYSFGVVLVELLLGTTALHSGRWSDVYDFYMAGGRLEIPTDLPPRARELIQGLLIRNRRTRWGAEEIRRWQKNETTEADRQRIREDAGFELVRRAARPYNVFASAPSDIPGLVRAMAEEPQVAEEELMAGDVLVNWLGELDAKLAREVRRDREKWRHAPRVALMSAMMRLDPTIPFTVAPNLTINSTQEFAGKVEEWVQRKQVDLGHIVSRSGLMRLEAWLRLKTDAESHLADAVAVMYSAWWDDRRSAALNPIDVRIAWKEMLWLLDPSLPYEVAPKVYARTPAEIARLAYSGDWSNGASTLYRYALDRWQDGSLCAWLRQRARDENGQVSPVVAQIDALRHKNSFAPEATWEVVLRMLDPTLPSVPLRITSGAPSVTIVAEWGTTVTRTLSYEATGPGLPFGLWKLSDAEPGMTIDPIQIGLRRGEFTVHINTLHGMEAGSAGKSCVTLEPGGNCKLQTPYPVFYRVKSPDSQRNTLIRNGALIGAGIAGGTRLIAFLCTGREWNPNAEQDDTTNRQPDPVTNTTAPATPDAANADDTPPVGYLGAGAVVILGAVLAFYVWLNALRKHGQF